MSDEGDPVTLDPQTRQWSGPPPEQPSTALYSQMCVPHGYVGDVPCPECAQQGSQGRKASMNLDGSRPFVVCGGAILDCKDIDAAIAKAEELAYQYNAPAYVLKPVRMVAPKRDVVTTEL